MKRVTTHTLSEPERMLIVQILEEVASSQADLDSPFYRTVAEWRKLDYMLNFLATPGAQVVVTLEEEV